MERTYCPHCGTKWFIEELDYTILQKINGYKITDKNVIIEESAKKLESRYTIKCVACGYQSTHDIKH